MAVPVFEKKFVQDIRQPVRVRRCGDLMFTGDSKADTIYVEVYNDGVPYNLTGTVTLNCIRVDGATVAVTGSISGNVAQATLAQACCAISGPLAVVMKITSGDVTSTILKAVYTVDVGVTGTTVDPGTIVNNVNTLIAAIETAVESIPADYSDLLAAIAPTYSNASTYAVGDYVWYDGDLYRCTTAISTAESWTAAHWESAVLSEDVDEGFAELKSAVGGLDETVNGVISFNFMEGKKIVADNSGYSIEDDADTSVSELIEITWEWDTTINVRWYYNGDSGVTLSYRIIYFDANQDYIGYRGTDGTTYRSVKNFEGGKYVRFSFKKGTVGKLMQNLAPQTVYWETAGTVTTDGIVQKLGDLDELETTDKSSIVDAINEVNEKADSFAGDIEEISDGLSELKTATAEEKTISETTEIETTINDGYLAKTGIVYDTGSYLNYGYTDKISVEPGDVIKAYNGNETIENILVLCEYDGDTFVAGYEAKANPYTVPDGVNYITITVNSTQKSGIRLTKTETSVELVPILLDRVVVLENQGDTKVDKTGTDQVTARNCQFMDSSPNLLDETAMVSGLINKNNGTVNTSYTNYKTSDWISVDSSTYYTFSRVGTDSPTCYYCWFKENKDYISGDQTNIVNAPTHQSPSNAKYIRFSFSTSVLTNDLIQFEKGSTATQYMDFMSGRLKPECKPLNGDIVLNLPAKIYALVGTEMNIYFDNLVEGHDTDFIWDVTCSVGQHLERGYRITASSAGTYTLVISATRKSDGASVSKTSSLIISASNAGDGDSASIIVLGDSTTDNGTAISKLHTNFDGDVMSVSTLGTRGTSPNNHEGRSGWKFSFYFTKASETYTDGRGTIYNPFYNPTSQTFDADYYFTNSGVSEPDYFFINLGINDMFGASSDTQMNSAIEENIEYCDAVIESVKDATSATKVCVCLTIPPNYSQDAYGREYKCGQNRERYKRNNLMWVKRLMEEYEGRESEGIYVIPINIALDTKYNMGFDTQPVNARNTDITYSMPIGNGGVHPVASGYWQIADVYTAFLKCTVS